MYKSTKAEGWGKEEIKNFSLFPTPVANRFHFPFYKLHVTVKLNDPTFNEYNIYEKGFDPHYLYDYHLKYLLNFLNINLNTALIEQVWIKVLNPDGETIVKY